MMNSQEITQKYLAVYWHGRVVDILTLGECQKKVQDAPQAHKIVFDEKTGKYSMVVCT